MKKRLVDVSKLVYDRDLTHFYHAYNRRYFKRRMLPNIEVYYGPLPAPHGKFKYGVTGFSDRGKPIYITLNKKIRNLGEDIVHITLLHEMVHASLPFRVKHGPKFKKEIRRLLLAGAFDEHLG